MRKSTLRQAQLLVKPSSIHGYGVFANQTINQDDIIEECYALVTKARVADYYDYFFNANGDNALSLGYGSLFNHSDTPNASYQFDKEYGLITFRARRPIIAGEEILISYGDTWFSSRALPVKTPSWRFRIRRFIQRYQVILRILVVLSVWGLAYFFLYSIQHR